MVEGPRGEPVLVLSLLPAGPGARRLAIGVIVLSVAVCIGVAPFARVPLPKVTAFMPSYESALVINDLITAALLFGQFAIGRSRALLVLASGYLFTALITIPHALTFPGLFSETGLLGAGSQSTAWLYMFWHGGFPGHGGRLHTAQERPSGSRRGHASVAILCSVVVVAAVVVALTTLATAGEASLPAIMQGNHYTPSHDLRRRNSVDSEPARASVAGRATALRGARPVADCSAVRLAVRYCVERRAQYRAVRPRLLCRPHFRACSSEFCAGRAVA